jgi:hypothetical protein
MGTFWTELTKEQVKSYKLTVSIGPSTPGAATGETTPVKMDQSTTSI